VCDDGNPCTVDVLMGGPCHEACYVTSNGDPNGTACQFDGGVTGICESHQCCVGCLSGAQCLSGQEPSHCGGGGTQCAACSGSDCSSSVCAGGGCQVSALPLGTPCDGGACGGNGCCHGCLAGDGGACQTGDTMAACGSGGVACAACKSGACLLDGGARCDNCVPSCGGKQCGSDGCGGSCGTCPAGRVCTTGTCVCAQMSPEMGDGQCSDSIDNNCDGKTDCAEQTCDTWRCDFMKRGMFCVSGGCTFGCRIGNGMNVPMFFPQGTVNPADPCQVCDANLDDSRWTPVPDGANCMNGAGTCHGGICCTGCLDSTGLCQMGLKWHSCGKGGANCVDCYTQGGGCGSCFGGQCNKMWDEGNACGQQPPSCSSCMSCSGINSCEFQTICTMGDCAYSLIGCCVCTLGRCAVGN
jgi:hypothetical protein